MRMSQKGIAINIVFKWSTLMLKIFVWLFACFDISNPLQTFLKVKDQSKTQKTKKKKKKEIKAYKMSLISSYLILKKDAKLLLHCYKTFQILTFSICTYSIEDR